jgi:folate-dependent phosphoribosylglycinamide formyltransferase PurN
MVSLGVYVALTDWGIQMAKRLLIFASGTSDGGGSGFANLVTRSDEGLMPNTEIVGVVSNYENGGVREHATKLGVRFSYLSNQHCNAIYYRRVVEVYKADFVALSGWLRPVRGLDPETTFNIHPGPLPRFGGKGMYGHHVHEAVLKAYHAGEIAQSAVTMHFVTDGYDEGPRFFAHPVPIFPDDTVDSLAARVNREEHAMQPEITDLVCSGEIKWTGMPKGNS